MAKSDKAHDNKANKRQNKRFVYNRVYTCIFLAFVQLAASLVLLFFVEHEAAPAVRWCIWILAAIAVLYLVNRTDNDSAAKMKWIIMILIFPIIGVAFFFLYGEGRPTVHMNKAFEQSKEENRDYLFQSENVTAAVEKNGREAAVCKYLFDYAGYPAFTDGDIEYYPTGKELFEAMMETVEKAERFILIEYFIIGEGVLWDRLRAALLKKAEEGVKIYIIFDDFGSVLVLPRKYENYMEALHPNIKCMAFNRVLPLFAIHQNNRDHRKMFVIDDKIAFTGGLNLADEYIGELVRFGDWKDSGVKVTGGAVQPFIVMFFNLWNAFNKKDKIQISELLGALDASKKELIEKEKSSAETHGERQGFFLQPFDDSPLDRKPAICKPGKQFFRPFRDPGRKPALKLLRCRGQGLLGQVQGRRCFFQSSDPLTQRIDLFLQGLVISQCIHSAADLSLLFPQLSLPGGILADQTGSFHLCTVQRILP